MDEKPSIHLPSPSFWPIVLAGGLVLMAIGMVSTLVFSIVGVIILLVAVAGWAMENRSQGESEHE